MLTAFAAALRNAVGGFDCQSATCRDPPPHTAPSCPQPPFHPLRGLLRVRVWFTSSPTKVGLPVMHQSTVCEHNSPREACPATAAAAMLFFSYFKTLVGKQVLPKCSAATRQATRLWAG
jgi:hypothetical protein